MRSRRSTILSPWRPGLLHQKAVGKTRTAWKNAENTEPGVNSMRWFFWVDGFCWVLLRAIIDILKLEAIWMEKEFLSRFADQSCLGNRIFARFLVEISLKRSMRNHLSKRWLSDEVAFSHSKWRNCLFVGWKFVVKEKTTSPGNDHKNRTKMKVQKLESAPQPTNGMGTWTRSQKGNSKTRS